MEHKVGQILLRYLLVKWATVNGQHEGTWGWSGPLVLSDSYSALLVVCKTFRAHVDENINVSFKILHFLQRSNFAIKKLQSNTVSIHYTMLKSICL